MILYKTLPLKHQRLLIRITYFMFFSTILTIDLFGQYDKQSQFQATIYGGLISEEISVVEVGTSRELPLSSNAIGWQVGIRLKTRNLRWDILYRDRDFSVDPLNSERIDIEGKDVQLQLQAYQVIGKKKRWKLYPFLKGGVYGNYVVDRFYEPGNSPGFSLDDYKNKIGLGGLGGIGVLHPKTRIYIDANVGYEWIQPDRSSIVNPVVNVTWMPLMFNINLNWVIISADRQRAKNKK